MLRGATRVLRSWRAPGRGGAVLVLALACLSSALACSRAHIDAPTMVPSSEPVPGAVGVPPRPPPVGPLAGPTFPGGPTRPTRPTGPWGGSLPPTWPSGVPWPWSTTTAPGAGAPLAAECARYQRCCFALASTTGMSALATSCGQVSAIAALGSQGETICAQINRAMQQVAASAPVFPTACR